jgi:apolipoprotein N-acyltransferase
MASLAVLAWLLSVSQGWRRGALLGGVFATAWLTGTFWWLYVSMHTYGGLAAPLAAAAVLALAMFLGSYYAVISGLFAHFAPKGRAQGAIVFGAFWLLAELARGVWWTGFPWGAGGYAHVQGPLAALARWVGVYGVGAVAAALAMLLVQVRMSDLRSLRAWALVLLLGAIGVAADLDRHCAVETCHTPIQGRKTPVPLVLLQGNIPQDEKFEPGSGVPMALQWYRDLLLQPYRALVVAPETALPLLPQQLPEGYLKGLQDHFAQPERAALIGLPLGSMEEGYTNSVMGLRAGQSEAYRYDKHHLVPFGEFNRGALVQPTFDWRGERFAPHICYEDLFGEELAALFVQPGRPAPTVLVNLSNIGWFGNTLAIDQHLAIARMRALEFERPMVRATNTGATAIIDHRGVVTHQLARHERGVLVGQVEGRDGAPTPYAHWAGHWGLWPLWALGGLVLMMAALRKRVPKGPRHTG